MRTQLLFQRVSFGPLSLLNIMLIYRLFLLVKNTLEPNDMWDDQEISQESLKFTSLSVRSYLKTASIALITAPSIAGILRVSYVIPAPGRCLEAARSVRQPVVTLDSHLHDAVHS